LRDTKKKEEKRERGEKKRRLIFLVLLSTLSLKLRSMELLERRLSFLKNTHRYDL